MKNTMLVIGALLVAAISFSGCMGSAESSDQGTQTTQATQGGDPLGGGEPMGPPPKGGPDGGAGGPPSG